jgi:hypothetical protein
MPVRFLFIFSCTILMIDDWTLFGLLNEVRSNTQQEDDMSCHQPLNLEQPSYSMIIR